MHISKLFFILVLISFLSITSVCGILATDTSNSVSNSGGGHVNINCRSDNACGKNGLIDKKFCSDSDVYQLSQTATCINPKDTESYCQIQKTSIIISDCGESTYSEYGKKYCKGNDIYQDNTYTLRGCKSGSCFANNVKDPVLIESCPSGCKNGECKIACYDNNDCGKSGYFGKEYCSDNDVFKLHRSFVCKKPGTSKSYCKVEETANLIFNCGLSGCISIGANYCYKNSVYQDQICAIRGCDSGACYARSSSPQTVKIEECDHKEKCIDGKCKCNPEFEVSYTPWVNISCVNNLINQSRNKTIYDSNNCHGSKTQTIIEYKTKEVCNICNITCIQNWQCTAWTSCSNGYQNRTCSDANNCNNSTGKPAETQSCSSGGCVPFWDCSSWSSCSGGYRDRTCSDLYNCNWNFGKPDETEECSSHQYSSDYGSISYSNNLVQPEKEPMISINEGQTQAISLESNKVNSPTGASISRVSGSSNIFIVLFIVAVILLIILIVLAVFFRR